MAQLQEQYLGVMNTPPLWDNHPIFDLKQFLFGFNNTVDFNESITDDLMLGKRVEQYIFYQLTHELKYSILLKNSQINQNNKTIGELDCIFSDHGRAIHLEIVYKFYLYDVSEKRSELYRWIGPNKNDTLIKKLQKLKNKQLPLLHHSSTLSLLTSLKIDVKDIVQKVCFKAQLFKPFDQNITFDLLNKNCLRGFYIGLSNLEQLSSCQFYIPQKMDWLIEPHHSVAWLNFDQFNNQVTTSIQLKKSPLCWLKSPNQSLQKFFVIWWSC